jgi:hypothetical protein
VGEDSVSYFINSVGRGLFRSQNCLNFFFFFHFYERIVTVVLVHIMYECDETKQLKTCLHQLDEHVALVYA